MKIAWLCPYPVQEMGSEIEWKIRKETPHSCGWIVNLQKALAKLPDVELHLLTLHPGIARTQCVERGDMYLHVIKNGIPFVYKGWPGRYPLDAKVGYHVESLNLCRELKKIKPDIVHAHGTEREYALTAMRSGYPYLISIQGIVSEFNKTDPCAYYKIMAPREEKVVRISQYFTCRTHFDIGFIRRLNAAAHIFDIPESMNPVFWNGQWERHEGARVFFAGGGAERKGLHELIEAMGFVVKRVPEVSIDAVGSFASARQKELQRMADERGVAIRFHGFKTAAEIASFHRQCSMFVLCSSNENSPNTLAEAMVSGMPVVSYNVGGVSSMVDNGKTGLLVKPHDIADLAAKIIELLVDGEKAQSLGGNAAEVARKRNHPDHVAQETMKAYRFILEKERSG